tara:strand:+ start:181 stop:501 length:321 start_codon:yes stop_codon:yes gene_type:complete
MDNIQAKEALECGKKLTHTYFTSKEWVKQYSDTQYIFEDGVIQNIEEFWSMRKDWSGSWREFKTVVNVGTVGHIDYGLKADPIEMITCGEPNPSKHKHPWWNKSRW